MNEREAIKFEMEMLKEESRRDFDMYFELRKYKSKRFSELQDRLREIDERDMYAENTPPQPKQPEITTLDKLIPKSYHMTPVDLQVERVITQDPPKKRTGKTQLVDYDVLTKEVEEFLKTQNEPVKLGPIKRAMEEKFQVSWTNFNTTMKHIVDRSNRLIVYKNGLKDFRYTYEA